MILTTGSEPASRAVDGYLVSEATAGTISLAARRASYNRILALKAGL